MMWLTCDQGRLILDIIGTSLYRRNLHIPALLFQMEAMGWSIANKKSFKDGLNGSSFSG